jgi:hypothetical protein
MSLAPTLFVLLILAVSALPLVVVFVMLFFAFDLTERDQDPPTSITNEK